MTITATDPRTHGTTAAPSALLVQDLHAGYGSTPVLTGADLTVAAGELVAVLGPSGCGKTTLLRAVAGFVTPTRGRVHIAGRAVAGPGLPGPAVPAERRGIGLVPQQSTLFGHLDVAGNVGFGLSRAERRRGTRVAELLELVGLAGLERRRPHELSGGQQQRVALARALAPRPGLVLLDEPFAALDAGLRETVRAEVREVLRRAGTAALLVTHDQDEALSTADSVAVLEDGRIAMHASPAEVYACPATLGVARFVGQLVELPAVLDGGVARTALGPVPVTSGTTPAGTAGVAVLRPEQFDLLPGDAADGHAGRLEATGYHGHDALHTVRLTGRPTGSAMGAAPAEPGGDALTVLVRTAGPGPTGPDVRVVVREPGRFFAG